MIYHFMDIPHFSLSLISWHTLRCSTFWLFWIMLLWTFLHSEFLLEWWKYSKIDCGDDCKLVNILKVIDMYKQVNYMLCELYLNKTVTQKYAKHYIVLRCIIWSKSSQNAGKWYCSQEGGCLWEKRRRCDKGQVPGASAIGSFFIS